MTLSPFCFAPRTEGKSLDSAALGKGTVVTGKPVTTYQYLRKLIFEGSRAKRHYHSKLSSPLTAQATLLQRIYDENTSTNRRQPFNLKFLIKELLNQSHLTERTHSTLSIRDTTRKASLGRFHNLLGRNAFEYYPRAYYARRLAGLWAWSSMASSAEQGYN